MWGRPQPVPKPQPKLTGRQKLGATVGAAAAGLMIATVALWEGKSNDPYADIVGVMTVCYGETRVQMRRYSDAECQDMLAAGLGQFAGAVLERNPELRDRPEMLAASTSLAYNIGTGAYARSTVARRFSQHRWAEGCDAFLMWNKAGGRVVRGLQRRREAERKLCREGLPANGGTT